MSAFLARTSSPPESLLASLLTELGHPWGRGGLPKGGPAPGQSPTPRPLPRLDCRSLCSAWPPRLSPVIINEEQARRN